TVLKVYVEEGQVIQAGDPLVTIGDLTSLVCRLPVDRKAVNAGEAITLTVEDVIVVGLVQALEPVSEDQQRLRDLAVSVTMAVVAVPNSGGKLSPGQAVYPAIVPKDPVTRIPLSSVSTATDGSRVVQVLRENVVRNVPVVLHGQIGKEDLFVSGPFTEHDHVIISASVALADRTAVQPTSVRTSASTAGGPATTGGAQSVRPAATTQPRKAGAAGF
ncbi:MAG: hypothetical protein O3B86_17930, partial [Planctomycetota bacterium]|nr:hypothetical protein [Planctomycetota bacterium]